MKANSVYTGARKACAKCFVVYPLTDEFFKPSQYTRDGFMSACRVCSNKYHLHWQQAKREKAKQND